jgi:hypothetical protein
MIDLSVSITKMNLRRYSRPDNLSRIQYNCLIQQRFVGAGWRGFNLAEQTEFPPRRLAPANGRHRARRAALSYLVKAQIMGRSSRPYEGSL